MKDKSRHHACPNGNDCASPPIRNNAKGEDHHRGQQGNFDKGFHRQNMRLQPSAFQPLGSPTVTTKKPRDSAPGLLCFASLARSVLRDDRAAELVVQAGGDEVDVLTDAVGAEGEAARRGEVVGTVLHEQVIVLDAN